MKKIGYRWTKILGTAERVEGLKIFAMQETLGKK